MFHTCLNSPAQMFKYVHNVFVIEFEWTHFNGCFVDRRTWLSGTSATASAWMCFFSHGNWRTKIPDRAWCQRARLGRSTSPRTPRPRKEWLVNWWVQPRNAWHVWLVRWNSKSARNPFACWTASSLIAKQTVKAVNSVGRVSGTPSFQMSGDLCTRTNWNPLHLHCNGFFWRK